MPPVAAVCLVFALVLSAALWIYLVRVCFANSTVHGIVALLLPPIALLSLLPHWQQYRQLFLMALGAFGFISIAIILA
ncbi:hypothetical protein [Microbulbifer aggregans]|uniref:hypothetical protein n=1 Tax=Microbulbifer aggregans TaxID=1769779 RepID=UPI001CFDE138|nr:hypothetical protein [Microbulbifer aggregans]